jgi:ABC-2 type transport system ATP-binding protein
MERTGLEPARRLRSRGARSRRCRKRKVAELGTYLWERHRRTLPVAIQQVHSQTAAVPAALAIEHLTVRFGDVTAVDDLSLSVHAGEVVALLGHNGAGKTTTVRTANGLAEPTAGSARVFGLSPAADGPVLRRRTAVLTDTPGIDERLTAREALVFAADLYDLPRRDVASRVSALLAEFGLAERADDRVGGFSRGMRQRLALARALLHRPELLFLDEPTTGLDPVATRQLHDIIRQVSAQEGRTVVLCTHNLIEAQALAHRVAVLARGRLVAIGTSAELARHGGVVDRVTVEVHPDDVAGALRAVAGVGPGAGAPNAAGGVLTLDGVTRERVPEVVARLAAAGVRVYRVAPQEPTLADAYFALQPADAAPAVGSAGRAG